MERGKQALGELIGGKRNPSPEALLDLLADRSRPPDEQLPMTGVGLEWERVLSPLFIESPVYGTRSSTVLIIDRKGHVTFVERVFSGGADPWMTSRFDFQIEQDGIGALKFMANREYPDSPRVGVGAVVLREGRVLLVRRGVAPANGLWAIPGGALELGETLKEGAEREILEETGITIRAGDPVFTCDVLVRDDDGRVRFHYVIVDLAADYVSGEVMGGDDALEARWVAPEELPELPATKTTLKLLRQIGFLPAPGHSGE